MKDNDLNDVSKGTPYVKQRKDKKYDKKKQNDVEKIIPAPTKGNECICIHCNEVFPSKTKLFKHLEIHGVEGIKVPPIKVVIMIGWLAELDVSYQ
jgi:hypothetical protein